MKVLRLIAPLTLVLLFGLFVGCGGGEKSDAEKAMKDAAENVAGMAHEAGQKAGEMAEDAAEGAQEMMEQVKKELADKEAELEKLTEKLKAMSPADMAGSAGKDLKAKIQKLESEIQELKDKLA